MNRRKLLAMLGLAPLGFMAANKARDLLPFNQKPALQLKAEHFERKYDEYYEKYWQAQAHINELEDELNKPSLTES